MLMAFPAPHGVMCDWLPVQSSEFAHTTSTDLANQWAAQLIRLLRSWNTGLSDQSVLEKPLISVFALRPPITTLDGMQRRRVIKQRYTPSCMHILVGSLSDSASIFDI